MSGGRSCTLAATAVGNVDDATIWRGQEAALRRARRSNMHAPIAQAMAASSAPDPERTSARPWDDACCPVPPAPSAVADVSAAEESISRPGAMGGNTAGSFGGGGDGSGGSGLGGGGGEG